MHSLWRSLSFLLLLCAAISLRAQEEGASSTQSTSRGDFEPADAFSDIDPWEGFNRGVFTFNDTADRYFMKPVATGYKWIMPTVAFRGVNNFFANVGEVPTSANGLLQGKLGNAALALLRFTINATVGFFGVFDVATDLGIEQQKEDFGQTMAVWGVPAGPYIMVPFFGPRTIRSGAGSIVDIYMDPIYVDNVAARNSMYAIKFTDMRADLLEAEALMSGDKYSFIRDAYLQNRDYLIMDGKVVDTFGDETEEDEDWLEDDWDDE